MNQNSIENFKEELKDLYYLNSALAVLNWDQEVGMPKKGSKLRANVVGSLAEILHNKFTSPKFSKKIKTLKKKLDNNKLDAENSCIIREIWREFSREKKMSAAFVKEFAKTVSSAQMVWAEAREKDDFKLFLPELKKIIELKRREARLVGYKGSPYNALLDIYEPGLNVGEFEMLVEELKSFLIPFLKKIKKSKIKIKKDILKGDFPIEKQVFFNNYLVKKIGFDFEAGRFDISTHPFTTSFHPQDVRMTTRYKSDDLFYSINSTIHEMGHALYEQGIPMEGFGTPLGDSVSLGIHESQSKLWENVIGRSMYFWKYFYPELKKAFPRHFNKIKLDDFYQSMNVVETSFVRTEADEVTYNLHIILRFEIERDLIEGSIAVEDLPAIWRDKMKEYLGIKVSNDSLGVLQDVHWAGGMIGYFPTYILGNLYSAQFYEAAKRDCLNLEREIENGNFAQLIEWLRKNIHIHGKFFSAEELVAKVTGEKLNNQYFINYIKEKYSAIYKIK